jgi:hypothetical protein
MTRSMAIRKFAVVMTGPCAALTVTVPGTLGTKEPPPQVSPDGLELKQQTNQRLVHLGRSITYAW